MLHTWPMYEQQDQHARSGHRGTFVLGLVTASSQQGWKEVRGGTRLYSSQCLCMGHLAEGIADVGLLAVRWAVSSPLGCGITAQDELKTTGTSANS